MAATDISLPLAKSSCAHLSGVGPKLAANLEKLGISNLQDLLFHLPIRYQDKTRITAMRDLRVKEYCVIEGVIKQTKVNRYKRPSLVCNISDATGLVSCRFFHFSNAQHQQMVNGKRMRCFGEIRYYNGHFTMLHPEYQIFDARQTLAVEENLTPIYHTTEGLGQKTIRQLINQALGMLKNPCFLEELLPLKIRQHYQLCELQQAIHFIHHPPPDTQLELLLEGTHPMLKRLIFEELIAHQLAMRRIRNQLKSLGAPQLKQQSSLISDFVKQLPFTLTQAQQRVINEIYQDLSLPQPMLRLVQGDVGCGKTIVALLAMLVAVDNDYQAVLMAPTEILAEQHYLNCKKALKSHNIHVAWLSGKLKARDRNYGLSAISGGQAKIIIGTHALFQKNVQFYNLGLVIIDEQHRFGVDQRLLLRDKGQQHSTLPHQLIMTATPIPRTLAMTSYADMDYSVIDELPPGRMPITTVALPNTRREEILERVKKHTLSHQQTYWVCTLIEESEQLQCQAATDVAEEIAQKLPELNVGLVHGRLSSEQKESIMSDFKQGHIDLLVATTVIEVGVDVPNASLIIIENPERLGLSQLHQLRGRVGRGKNQSHCVLLYQPNLSEYAIARLAIMRETNDGFKIAEHDMKLRGPGEILGTKQTGITRFKVANIIRDKKLLPTIKPICELIESEHSEQITKLIERWLADNEQYARV